jgi:TRAP transporter TAXI family solute receptor
MSGIERRSLAGLLAAGALFPRLASGQTPALALMTAGQGSAFLPYGQGIAKVVTTAGAARIEVKESKGSNENLDAVDASASTLGTAFLGSAYDAINGKGFATGHKHANVRALFPMYETAFMVATLKSRSLTNLQSLDGKKVGCGPAAGPAEGYFRAAAEIAGIKPLVVGGTPANQGRQLIAGEIDAFWQGAVLPIPSLVAVANAEDCIVFGLDNREAAAMRRRFAYMTEVIVAADTYRGQTAPLTSVAAWNMVIAHKDLPEATAYAITKAVLSSKDLAQMVGAPGGSTKAQNAEVLSSRRGAGAGGTGRKGRVVFSSL